MSTNVSKQRREDLISKIAALRGCLSNLCPTENRHEYLSYLAELEKEIRGKKYGLIFEGHRETIDEILDTHTPVLTENKKLFINKGGQINYLIEGDNLAALKLLLKSHTGKVDLIYIDPPYNRGGSDDFIYDDNRITKTDSYIHSKWLSFMKCRLEHARKLLKPNGAIFISIDDNEQAGLKLLCDSIFGEDNFAGIIPWRKRTAKTDVPFGISQDFEWILVYARSNKFDVFAERQNVRKYFETDDLPGRKWRIHDLTTQRTNEERERSFFTIVNPKTGEEFPANPNRTWAITKDTFPKYLKEKRIVFPGDYEFLKISKPQLRYFKDDDERKAIEKTGSAAGISSISTLLPSTVGMTQDGTKDLAALFDRKVFPYPKPIELIKYLLKISLPNKYKATVLDFFAGSGTTGQAVMQLNVEEGSARRFILCTNNENNICREVTYERISRVIKKEDHKASLKYYKLDYVPIDKRLYYEYADELLKHVRELVELENGINFIGNAEIAIIITDKELKAFLSDTDKLSVCRTIYLGHDVLPDGKQESLFKRMKINIVTIPDYYYGELESR